MNEAFKHVLTEYPPQFVNAFRFTLEEEGIWSNHPYDKGGETIFGISRKAHPKWYGWEMVDLYKGPNFPSNLVDGTESIRFARSVVEFYFHGYHDGERNTHGYWMGAACDRLPDYLQLPHFDAAVNHGIVNAIKILQKAVKTKADGIYGHYTNKAVWKNPKPEDVIGKRLEFYMGIIAADGSQVCFAPGWSRRALRVFRRMI